MRTLFTFIVVLLTCAELHSQWTLQNKLTYQQDLTSVYFTDQNNGFAVGDFGLLFITTDGGNNWNLNSGVYKGKLNSIFIVGNVAGQGITGYAAGDKGTMIKIVNGSFTAKQVTNVTVSLNSSYFTSSAVGYCCGNSGTILKTSNGGTNWFKLNSGTTYSLSSIYFTDSNTGYAAGGTNTNNIGIILKTTDAGSTWKTQYSGQANRYLYSVHFENSTTGWACGWNGTVLKTTNGGTNWVLQTSNVTTHLRSVCFKSLQEGVAVGAGGTVIVTTNGGTNWGKMQSGTTEQLNSVFIPGDNIAVAVGNKGVILRNEGNTLTLKPVTNNSRLTKVYFATKDIGWINAGGLLYKTTNGGQTWLWKKTTDSITISDFSFLNTQVGYAISGNKILKTDNGGETWNVKFTYHSSYYPDESVSFISICSVDNNFGWSLLKQEFYSYGIFSTTDGGNSWQEIGGLSTPMEYLSKVYFQNKSTGYLLRDSFSHDINQAKLYRTTDGGKNWIGAANFSAGFYEFSGVNDIKFIGDKGFIVGGYDDYDGDYHQITRGAMIIKSTDGGQNWLRKEYDIPNNNSIYQTEKVLRSVCFPTSSVGYTVGSCIMKTIDGGNTWFLQNTGLAYQLYSVYFTDADNGWTVGDDGVILKHQKETTSVQNNWEAKLKFCRTSNPDHEILYDSLLFGQNKTATNGLDSKLGETELPPVPPEGTFDARFTLPDDPSLSTDKDIRNIKETNISWNINLQYKDFPLKISWADQGGVNLVPGEFYLTIDGSIIKVNMKDTTQVIIDNLPQSNSITINYYSPEHTITEGITVKYDEGWNLISIPLKENNMTRTDIFYGFFHGILSNLFGFDGKYYIPENLENGRGYWATISYEDHWLPFTGVQVYHPVNIKKGWNLVGPFALDVPINKITTIPTGIVTTPFYGFNNGYFTASTLNPGKGYWVKASNDGVINYNVKGLAKEAEPLAVNQNNCGKITITDNTGCSTILYDVFEKDVDLHQYEMPPLPPSGIFDARYTSGLMAERLDADGKAIIFNSASYPVTIKAEGIDLRLSYTVNGIQTETILQNGSSYTINESSIRVVEVKRTAERIIPKQFALHQNYPNPFNPRTRIKYDLPEKSKVNLSVYNILGERIAELVNSELEAGYHEVEFNANSLSSGVYIYRIDTDKNHSVKKMLLLK